MNFQHKNLAAGKWFTMTLAQQMANIGSEVGRSLSWREKGQPEHFEPAFSRALELFDLTLADSRWQWPKLKEVARSREVFCDFCFGNNRYNSSPENLNQYFLSFAVLARAAR